MRRVRGLARGLARGCGAALRSAVVVRGRAFDALLVAPPSPRVRHRADPTVPDPTAPDPADAPVVADATRVALGALRWLRWLPGWRNTCLYRAVAECLVLRAFGMPATLRLGVAHTGPATSQPARAYSSSTGRTGAVVAAHAWVDCPGHRCRTTDGWETNAFATLRHAAPAATAHQRPSEVSA